MIECQFTRLTTLHVQQRDDTFFNDTRSAISRPELYALYCGELGTETQFF